MRHAPIGPDGPPGGRSRLSAGGPAPRSTRLAILEAMSLWMTGDAAADQLLDSDPFALLIGMLLEQKVR